MGEAATHTGRCPGEQTLAGFLDGDLEAGGRAGVLEHLDGCQTCRRVVAVLAGDRGGGAEAPTVHGAHVDAQIPAPGTRVGRFEVRGALGRGAMGVVLRAYDPDLGRDVALKVVSSGQRRNLDGSLRARQLREARALAAVSHENVVQVFDVGLWNGHVFMAMELVRGQTLRQWRAERPRSWIEIVEVLREASRGLQAVHAAGLVHRDFKPDNVLISEEPASGGSQFGRVLVADFGLVCVEPSRRTDRDTPDSAETGPLGTPLTQRGEVVGTPAYMAPEQHADEPVSPRADQFAFCVTAFELLYGSRPFAGGSIQQLLTAIATGTIVRPIGSAVPRHVHRALVRGLSADPRERFGSMDELDDALARPRRRGAGRWLVGGALLSAFAGFALGAAEPAACDEGTLDELWPGQRQALADRYARHEPPLQAEDVQRVESTLDRYVEHWNAAHRRACRADRSPEIGRDGALACLQTGRDRLAALLEVLIHNEGAGLDRAQAAVSSLEPPQVCLDDDELAAVTGPQTDASVALHRATALAKAAAYDDAANAAERILDRTEPGQSARARALRIRGIASRGQGRLPEARADLMAAFFEARQARDGHTALQAGMELATLLGEELGELDEGLTWYQHAVKATPAVIRDRPRWAALAEDTHGLLLRAKGDLPAALQHLQRAVELAEQHDDIVPLNRAIYLSHLASTLAMHGKAAAARPLFEQALALTAEHAGPWHPQIGIDRLNYGNVLLADGKVDDAHAQYELAILVYRRTHGDDHPLLAQAYGNLGMIERLRGNDEAALRQLHRAKEAFVRTYGPDHPMVAKVVGFAARVHLARRDTAAATDAAVEAIGSLEASGGDPDALGRAHVVVGLAHFIDGAPGKAATAFERALQVLSGYLGDGHGFVGRVHGRLCMARADAGDPVAALSDCDRAVAVARDLDLDLDHRAHLAEQLRARAFARLRAGRIDEATKDLDEAADTADDGTDPGVQGFVRSKVAAALADNNLMHRAREQAAIASSLYEQAGPAWDREPGVLDAASP